MFQRISAGAFLFISGMLIIAMLLYEVVPLPFIILCLSVFAIFAHFITRFLSGVRDDIASQMFTVTLTLYLAMLPPSFIYYHWKKWGFGNFIPATFIMKVSLLLFVLSALYFNYILSRTKTTYKRKRENERIQRMKENAKEKPFAKNANILSKKNEKPSDDPAEQIHLVLGESFDDKE